jgi:spore coat polysaccharide biosynthesis protein SpsF
MSILAITQARLRSSRYPEKILKEVCPGKSLLQLHLERILKSKYIDNVCVATTFEEGVESILAIAEKVGVQSFQGSEVDVLERFVGAINQNDEMPEYVIRLTSDCPLIDSAIIDKCIESIKEKKVDYLSNIFNPTYPDGQDVEIFTTQSLIIAQEETTEEIYREHVTPYIWLNSTMKGKDKFTSFSIENDENFSDLRITLDYEEDYIVIKKLVELKGENATWLEYALELRSNTELRNINKKFKRNEGSKK